MISARRSRRILCRQRIHRYLRQHEREFQKRNVRRKRHPHETHPVRIESYAKWRLYETLARLVVLLLAALPPVFAQSEPPAYPDRRYKGCAQAAGLPPCFRVTNVTVWMLLGDKPLIFKVDPLSTGSHSLVVGTEEMPPGNRIPTHKTCTKAKSDSSTRERCASPWRAASTTPGRVSLCSSRLS